jgi:hypothetical protein
MRDTRARQWLGLAGLIFVVLVVIAVVTGNNVSAHSTAAQVVASVHQHKTGLQFSAFDTGLAVFEGLFFLWYLREYLCEVAANRRLATLAFAGAIIFAASGALGAGIKLSMADAVDHVDPVVLQTLNVLQNDLNTFMAGVGTAIFLVANGIAVIRNGPLPTWVGWVGVVLGVLGALLGAPAAALWILIASIVILVRAGQATPAPAA